MPATKQPGSAWSTGHTTNLKDLYTSADRVKNRKTGLRSLAFTGTWCPAKDHRVAGQPTPIGAVRHFKRVFFWSPHHILVTLSSVGNVGLLLRLFCRHKFFSEEMKRLQRAWRRRFGGSYWRPTAEVSKSLWNLKNRCTAKCHSSIPGNANWQLQMPMVPARTI
jgi:hypothetical protein